MFSSAIQLYCNTCGPIPQLAAEMNLGLFTVTIHELGQNALMLSTPMCLRKILSIPYTRHTTNDNLQCKASPPAHEVLGWVRT